MHVSTSHSGLRRAHPRATVLALTMLAIGALAVPTAAHAQKRAAAQGTLTEKLVKPFSLRPIGPGNTSGRVTSLAVVGNGRTVYVGSAGGGVWKTTNRATTWEPLWNDQPFAAIGDVAVAPSDSNVVWVGTGERNSLRSEGWGNGVYKSTDGGKSWTHVGLEDSREIGRIAIDPRNPSTVYVAALGHLWGANPERGVYKTTDAGKSWKKVLFVNDTTGFVDLKMDPKNPDVLYAAAWHRIRWGGGHMEGAGKGSGIYKTVDGGAHWTELTDPRLNNGLPTRELGRIGLAIYPKNPSIVYAVIQAAHGNVQQDVSKAGGVFRSNDAGATWTRVNDLSAIPDYYYNEIYVDPNDPDNVIVNGTFLMRSTDGGKSFSRFDLGNIHVDHHALWVDPTDSDHMILGNDGGAHISYDGGENWEHENIPISQFYTITIDSTKTPYYVCGGLQDNGVWCGPSRTRERTGISVRDWYTIYGGDGMWSAVSPDDPNILYAEAQFGSLGRFDVRTGDVTPIQPEAEDSGPESGYAFRWDWTAPLIISKYDPTVLYFGGNHLFKLTNRGDSWQILGPDMTRQSRMHPEPQPTYTSYGALFSIAESPVNRNVLWTGSDDGLIWTTSDGGASWRQVTDNIRDEAPKHCVVGTVDSSHFDAQTAYAAFDCHTRDDYHPYVYRTTDGGRSWTNITGDLPEGGGSFTVREDPVNPQLLFVGTEQGLFVSNQGGGHWVRLKNGLPTAGVRSMNFALSAGELAVGTMGRGVYILDAAPLEQLTPEALQKDAVLMRVEPAHEFQMIDTYESTGDHFFTVPNPEQGAVITYYLKSDLGHDAKLTIRREGSDDVVQTLTGSGDAGVHQVRWDLQSKEPRPRKLGDPTSARELRQVLPGRYLVELKAGGETLTQPIVVEKGWVEETPGRLR